MMSSVSRYKRGSLKILGTVGEPINPEAWQWYYTVVGDGRCPIVDTFWQTETVSVVVCSSAFKHCQSRKINCGSEEHLSLSPSPMRKL